MLLILIHVILTFCEIDNMDMIDNMKNMDIMDMITEGIREFIQEAFKNGIIIEDDVKMFIIKLSPGFKTDVIFQHLFPILYQIEYINYKKCLMIKNN